MIIQTDGQPWICCGLLANNFNSLSRRLFVLLPIPVNWIVRTSPYILAFTRETIPCILHATICPFEYVKHMLELVACRLLAVFRITHSSLFNAINYRYCYFRYPVMFVLRIFFWVYSFYYFLDIRACVKLIFPSSAKEGSMLISIPIPHWSPQRWQICFKKLIFYFFSNIPLSSYCDRVGIVLECPAY